MNFAKTYNFKKRSFFFTCIFLLTANSLLFAHGREAIENYLNNITIGDAVESGALKVFPLLANVKRQRKQYVTLDEAFKKGWLTINELKSESVNTVRIQNKGERPVLIMAGEIIKGAKQDRTLQKDILLPAGGAWTKVPVFCVERGRWHYNGSSKFESASTVVPNSVRKEAMIKESQGAVWSKISSFQKNAGVSSPTETVMDVYKDEKIKEKIDKSITKELEQLPEIYGNIVGAVVTSGNEIICLDTFANNELHKKLWAKLIKSYVLDANSDNENTVGTKDVEQFINIIKNTKKTKEKTNGLGKIYKLNSPSGKGSALVDDGSSVVHISFFVGKESEHNTTVIPPTIRHSILRSNY